MYSRLADLGPSPSPFEPWQDLQFLLYNSLPVVITEGSVAFMVLFIVLYLAGIVHGPPSFCAIAIDAVKNTKTVHKHAASLI